MSASNSPSNPGQRKTTSSNKAPKPSRRTLPVLVAGGTALTLMYAYLRIWPDAKATPFRTPGVKNIERAYRGGGATANYQPAYGGTKQGDRTHDNFRGDGEGTLTGDSTGDASVKSAGKREFNLSGPNPGAGDSPSGAESGDVGNIQRPAGSQSTGVGKAWNRFKYGNEDQK